jgi:1-acyl-sn-glycerol-3-phosphate acyltransferase
MKRFWYACCHWLCARVYFERITVVHPERMPKGGPNLYVGLHRNGAMDGFIYRQVAPRGVFVISTQLRRSFFARLFFCGIALARKSDEEDRSQNDEALSACVRLLGNGGELFVFPEGSNSAGCRICTSRGCATWTTSRHSRAVSGRTVGTKDAVGNLAARARGE